MDALTTELSRLQRDPALSQSVEDVDKILEQLCKARESIASGENLLQEFRLALTFSDTYGTTIDPNSASITLAKLQNPVKQGFDRVTESLKKVYAGHNKYGKALDKVRIKQGTSAGFI